MDEKIYVELLRLQQANSKIQLQTRPVAQLFRTVCIQFPRAYWFMSSRDLPKHSIGEWITDNISTWTSAFWVRASMERHKPIAHPRLPINARITGTRGPGPSNKYGSPLIIKFLFQFLIFFRLDVARHISRPLTCFVIGALFGICTQLTSCAYLSSSSRRSQKCFTSSEMPPSGENNFNRKPDFGFLLVFCWYVLLYLEPFQSCSLSKFNVAHIKVL